VIPERDTAPIVDVVNLNCDIAPAARLAETVIFSAKLFCPRRPSFIGILFRKAANGSKNFFYSLHNSKFKASVPRLARLEFVTTAIKRRRSTEKFTFTIVTPQSSQIRVRL